MQVPVSLRPVKLKHIHLPIIFPPYKSFFKQNENPQNEVETHKTYFINLCRYYCSYWFVVQVVLVLLGDGFVLVVVVVVAVQDLIRNSHLYSFHAHAPGISSVIKEWLRMQTYEKKIFNNIFYASHCFFWGSFLSFLYFAFKYFKVTQ